MSFEVTVIAPIRAYLGRPIRAPSGGTWAVRGDGGTTTLHLMLPTEILARNLQTDAAASPWFLLAFGFWLEQATGGRVHLEVEVVGPVPREPSPLAHYRRAWIALEALEFALGGRLTVRGAPDRRWPERPIFNLPRKDRGAATGRGGGREHRVEVQLTRRPEVCLAAPAVLQPLDAFHRQLPLGLFDGLVSNVTRWTPGSGAQADLWATSPSGLDFHLFELKVAGNRSVGVLPELLTYAWMLHRARTGLDDGTPVTGGGQGLDAARRAERLHAWILAPAVHPLLLHDGRSPLSWLALGLADMMSLGMLFFEDSGLDAGFVRWLPDHTWTPDSAALS